MSKHVITYRDLQVISSSSKAKFTNLSLPLHISDKKAEYVDLLHIAMIESILTHLNSKGLLTELVRLDYTDASDDLEALD